MYKNKLNKTMENMYASKLIDWEFEGKREEVSYCQEFVHQLDMYMNLTWEERKEKDCQWMKRYPCFNNDKMHEATRWCIGYASTYGFLNIQVKNIESKVYDKNLKYLYNSSKNIIYCD